MIPRLNGIPLKHHHESRMNLLLGWNTLLSMKGCWCIVHNYLVIIILWMPGESITSLLGGSSKAKLRRLCHYVCEGNLTRHTFSDAAKWIQNLHHGWQRFLEAKVLLTLKGFAWYGVTMHTPLLWWLYPDIARTCCKMLWWICCNKETTYDEEYLHIPNATDLMLMILPLHKGRVSPG